MTDLEPHIGKVRKESEMAGYHCAQTDIRCRFFHVADPCITQSIVGVKSGVVTGKG
jgi:hypothetical protein